MKEAIRSLREVLAELHETLEATPEVDEAARRALRDAALEIQSALDDQAREGDRANPLAENLSQALERVGGAYPRLTQLVGRVVESLSDLGI